MANLSESSVYEPGIYQLEETDLVIAGPNGIANQQAKQLANRTVWLRNAMRGYAGYTMLSASKTLTISDVDLKLVLLDANNASIELGLPSVTNDHIGLTVSIMAYNVSKQVTISSSSSIILFTSSRQRIYLGNFEVIKLAWTGTSWLLVEYPDSLTNVGLPIYAYSQLQNTVIANGQLLQRSEYPRLWEYANSLSGSIIQDVNWNTSPGNKGFFSTGTNNTNFRIPDLRAMFIRGLDLGAGIDLGRQSSQAGGYEADDFKSHSHAFVKIQTQGSGTTSGYVNGLSQGNTSKDTEPSGGVETRPKNIGLIPLIRI